MTQQEYEQKKRECWKQFCKDNGIDQKVNISIFDAFDQIFDRAYALGKQEKDAEVQHCWSTEWYGLKWCVHAIFRKTFLWFSWNESYEFAGPFRTKQDAKKCAKNLRRKHCLSASNESKR